MSRSARNPTNWDEYQYGTSFRGSVSSAGGRSIRFEDHERSPSPAYDLDDATGEERHDASLGPALRRRGSSVVMHLNVLTQVGGANSIGNFARSWQRAAEFVEVAPNRPSFVLASDSDDDEQNRYRRMDIGGAPLTRTSLLRQHLEASSLDQGPNQSVGDADRPAPNLLERSEIGRCRADSESESALGSVRSNARPSQSIFAIAPHLATPLAGSYGTSYGTLQSTLNEPSTTSAVQLWQQQQVTGTTAPGRKRRPLIVKEMEQDGKIVLAVEGQSTLPQTVFNSINVLIGVGLLSLPLGMKYSGWICGMIFLTLTAMVTSYTAMLLAKCMDFDVSLITFADLAFVSYGQKARIVTALLFLMELLAACVALIVLFADTLDLLIPGVGVIEWKILAGLFLIPLNFAPLRLLSFTSVVGIFSCSCLILIVFIDGLIKPNAPGSLREPVETYLFPANWLTLPLSFGLLMSPYGGHGVFPQIYRDMRHPHKYGKAVKATFMFTYFLDAATAIIGLLMFGDGVMDEITLNIIGTSGYPKSLTVIMCILIAIVPLTKVPLNAQPIISTLERLTGLGVLVATESDPLVGLSRFTRGLSRVTLRVIIIIVFVVIAILFPAFDSIMAFMGSALCFTVCVVLPCIFHLKIFGKKISLIERVFNYLLITICSSLAVVGTVFAFLPKSKIGAD